MTETAFNVRKKPGPKPRHVAPPTNAPDEVFGTKKIDLGASVRVAGSSKVFGPTVRIKNSSGTVHVIPRDEAQYLMSRNPKWEVLDMVDDGEDEFLRFLKRYTEEQIRHAALRLELDLPANASKAYVAARLFDEGGTEIMETLLGEE